MSHPISKEHPTGSKVTAKDDEIKELQNRTE